MPQLLNAAQSTLQDKCHKLMKHYSSEKNPVGTSGTMLFPLRFAKSLPDTRCRALSYPPLLRISRRRILRTTSSLPGVGADQERRTRKPLHLRAAGIFPWYISYTPWCGLVCLSGGLGHTPDIQHWPSVVLSFQEYKGCTRSLFPHLDTTPRGTGHKQFR